MKTYKNYIHEIWGKENSCLEIILNEEGREITIKLLYSLFIGIIFLVGFFSGYENNN